MDSQNDHLPMYESYDSSNITFDIIPACRNTITSLSNICQTKAAVHTMVSGYQPILSIASNANGASLLEGNKMENLSVVVTKRIF